ncbi:hypothetical protein Tco_0961206 [Tanacetum coccineum]
MSVCKTNPTRGLTVSTDSTIKEGISFPREEIILLKNLRVVVTLRLRVHPKVMNSIETCQSYENPVQHIKVLGFPSFLLVFVSGQSRTLVGQGSAVIVIADVDHLPQSLYLAFVLLGRGPNVYSTVQAQWACDTYYTSSTPPSLVLLLHAALMLRAVNVTRLRFRCCSLPSRDSYPQLFLSLGSTIMEIKSVLNQKTLDVFCRKSHIPECVHPELPNLNQTIHEAPAGKIGVYTRFFEFANFRLPLSAFLVDILSRNYELDKDTYPTFLYVDREVMDLFAFIHVANPTNVKVGERESFNNEASLLEFTMSAEKGDSVEGGNQGAKIEPTTHDAKVVVSKKPKGRRLKRQAIGDAIEPNHPPKKLREDHDVISGATTGGKSVASLQILLDSSRLPAEIGVVVVPTVPFVTSFVTLSPKREGGDYMDSITGPNLHTTGASRRFVILSDSSHHSSINASQAEVNSFNRSSAPPVVTTAVVVFVPTPETVAKVVPQMHPSLFHDSSSTGMVGPNIAGTSQPVENEPSLESGELNAESQIFLPQWNIRSDSLLDNNTVAREFVDHLAPPALIRTEYGLGKRTRLHDEFDKKVDSLKAKDDEIESLKAQLLLKGVEAAEALRLCAQVESAEQAHAHEMNALQRENIPLEKEKATLAGKVTKLQSLASDKEHKLADSNNAIASLQSEKSGLVNQDAQAKVLDDRVTKLNDDFIETCLHLEEKFYPHLLTTISDRRWLLTHGMKLAIVKCLNSSEYLNALGGGISRAIEKGMQDGLAASINHGKAGRSLGDVAALNTNSPST